MELLVVVEEILVIEVDVEVVDVVVDVVDVNPVRVVEYRVVGEGVVTVSGTKFPLAGA